jgi:hypothetical protein
MTLETALLHLAKTVCDIAANEAAVVTTVVHLVNSGIVQLCRLMRAAEGGFARIAIHQLAALPVTAA